MATTMERHETETGQRDELGTVLQRVEELQRRVAELEEWLTEVADDLADAMEGVR